MEMPQRNRPTLFTLIALGLIAVLPESSGGAPPRSNHIPVTTYISDTDSAGNPTCIGSDGSGAYLNGVGGVSSILAENGYNGIKWGDWQLDTNSATARKVGHSFDMADAVLPGDPHYQAPATPPWLGNQLLKGKTEVKCSFVNRDMLTMTAGSSFTCPLINNFNTTTMKWMLHPGLSFTGFAETTDALVTCNTADSGGCNDWYIDPIVPGQAVGRLVGEGSGKKNPGLPNGGDFYMKFHIHVTRP
jgi:hypothetical protein